MTRLWRAATTPTSRSLTQPRVRFVQEASEREFQRHWARPTPFDDIPGLEDEGAGAQRSDPMDTGVRAPVEEEEEASDAQAGSQVGGKGVAGGGAGLVQRV